MVQKRSFGEMKKGGGVAAWNYSGGAEDKEQSTKRSLNELRTNDLPQENYDGDAEEPTVRKKKRVREPKNIGILQKMIPENSEEGGIIETAHKAQEEQEAAQKAQREQEAVQKAQREKVAA
ncbi:hypothetical protein VE02_08787 [Pseudogymnoascus sp. 03VT05]|nr:hypothetical protein VE02_08787 [Pseudogymnoascus sp. 03VT05]